jgi:hypothetical protein
MIIYDVLIFFSRISVGFIEFIDYIPFDISEDFNINEESVEESVEEIN